MTELLAQHDKIEKKEQINPGELQAIKEINKFFDKNKWDAGIAENLKNGTWPEDLQKNYDLIKESIVFSDAYDPLEYWHLKKLIVTGIEEDFGNLGQLVGEWNYYKNLHEWFLYADLMKYNTTRLDANNPEPVSISKFMTNFKAEKISTLQYETVEKVESDRSSVAKEKEDKVGKIFLLNEQEKSEITKTLSTVASWKHSADIDIFWQSDGTRVNNVPIINKRYSDLRNDLFNWCSPQVKENLNNIFPPFDEKNANLFYAMSRGLSKISFLSPELKNAIFNWPLMWPDANGARKLWNVNFKFNQVTDKWDQHTFWGIEIKPNLETQSSQIINYLKETVLRMQFQPTASFTIKYPKEKRISPDPTAYDAVTWWWLSTNFMISKQNNWNIPSPWSHYNNFRPWKSPNTITDKSDRLHHMNIVIPYTELDKYKNYITYTDSNYTDQSTKYSVNPKLSFAKVLDLFQSQQKPWSKEALYANQVRTTLENFDVLASTIESNPALKKQLAEDLKTEINPRQNKNYESSWLYKYLMQLGYKIDSWTKTLVAIPNKGV